MSYLVAAVVLLSLLALFNLVLTLAVARRMRERPKPETGIVLTPPAGRVGPFTTTALDGSQVTGIDLGAGTVVAFFTPDCAPCRTALPAFARYARGVPGGPARVLAVITVPAGAESAAREPAELLRRVARVVVEAPGGAVQRAFGASAFPVFGLLGTDGRVLASTAEPETLPALDPS